MRGAGQFVEEERDLKLHKIWKSQILLLPLHLIKEYADEIRKNLCFVHDIQGSKNLRIESNIFILVLACNNLLTFTFCDI